MHITMKWLTHPKDSAVQLFLPSLISVSALVALAALLYGLGGENPVGPVTSFLSDTWEALSPLVLFMVAVWAFHFISYLLVDSFAKDLSVVARTVRRLSCAYWRRFCVPGSGPRSALTSLLLSHRSAPSAGARLRG